MLMRVLSCNVRTSTAKDGDNDWRFRKDLCLRVVRQQQAGLICCQEMNRDQCLDFQAGLPGYEWFGMADETTNAHPVDSIFYQREVFQRISAGGYWLSQTPHIPGSSSWDSRCVRLCNWLRLVEVASGREFRLVNTHIDHISQLARENQMAMILADSAAYPPTYPQILTGDLNCNVANPVIQAILAAGWNDSYQAVHGEFDPGSTFHGFKGPAFDNRVGKIDWIFTRGDLKASSAAIITTQEGGRYPSDHYFISAELELI